MAPRRPYISLETGIKYIEIIKLGKNNKIVIELNIAANITLKSGDRRYLIIFNINIAVILLKSVFFKFKAPSQH
jgi:hypothetical protein